MLRFSFNLLLSFFTLCVIFFGFIFIFINPSLPDIDNLDEVQLEIPLRVYSNDGSLIAEFGELRRTAVAMRDIPRPLVHAFIAAEDDRFYEHPGVDWHGLLRAAWSLASTGAKTQGGSTITMQVARNYFLSRKKSYVRKLREIILALKIENVLTKDQIMELYLNKVYFGQRAYGITAAAHVYYGISIHELELPQMAMLAGLLQLPSRNNPITDPASAIKRRNYVLRRMLENGFIDQTRYQQALDAKLIARLHGTPTELDSPYMAEMVRQRLLERFGERIYTDGFVVTTTIRDKHQQAANNAIRESLYEYDRRHGYRGAESHLELPLNTDPDTWQSLLEPWEQIADTYPALVSAVNERSATVFVSRQGFRNLPWEGMKWARPYIAVDRTAAQPERATDILKPGALIRVRDNVDGILELTQIPEVQGSLLSLDVNNGAVLALVGGYDYHQSKFNRVTQAMRQPGSSFKPFIYSAALEMGKSAASIINDAPIVKHDDARIAWRPQNYSEKFYGPTRLREALIKSRNLVSIRLLNEIGVQGTLEHLERFGFDSRNFPRSLSLALGSADLTSWELTRAYSVLANGGYLIEPWFIEKVATQDGELIFEANPATVCRDCKPGKPHDPSLLTQQSHSARTTQYPGVSNIYNPASNPAPQTVDPRNAYIINSITRDVIKYGTGRKALVLGRGDLSGKTGTTNQQRDAWFAGYNARIATVVWVGFDENQVLGRRETGARAALPMWIRFMETALHGTPEEIMPRPVGLVNVKINADTGKLAKSGDARVLFEIFRADNPPPSEDAAPYASPSSDEQPATGFEESLF